VHSSGIDPHPLVRQEKRAATSPRIGVRLGDEYISSKESVDSLLAQWLSTSPLATG
jgi:hypothetical protein